MSETNQNNSHTPTKKLTVGKILPLSLGIGGIASMLAILRSVTSGAAFSFLGVSGLFGLGGAALLGGITAASVAIAVPLISFGVKKLIGWIRQKKEQRRYHQELRRQYLQNAGIIDTIKTDTKNINAKDWRRLLNIKNFKVSPSRKFTFAKVNCALLDAKGKKDQAAICLVSRKPVLVETITKNDKGENVVTKVKKYKILNPFKKAPNNFTYASHEELEAFGEKNKINPIEFMDESSKSLNVKIIQKRFFSDIAPEQSNSTIFQNAFEDKQLNPNFNKVQAVAKPIENPAEASDKQMDLQKTAADNFMKSLTKDQREQLAALNPTNLSKIHKSLKTR